MNKKLGLKSLTIWMATAALMLGLATPAPAASQPETQTASEAGSERLGLLYNQDDGGSADPSHFTDIDFLSGTTGYAAGNGFLIGTSDGGSHWQGLYKGPLQFDRIIFTDKINGWALARTFAEGEDKLLKTSNGGSKWENVNTGALNFKQIDVKGKTIFGYTDNGVYKSSDGGKKWTVIHVPANTRSAVFNDAKGRQGYTLTAVPGEGYTVMKTKNGGTSWSKVLQVPSESTAGGELYSSRNQVWVLLYGDSGMSQVSYSLYASRNSGTSWNRIIGQDTAGGGPAPGTGKALVTQGPASPGGHPGNMELIGGNAAYLAAGSPAGGVVGIGRSLDGGKSWVNEPSTINGYAARISFPSAKTGWLAVTSPANAAIYATYDSGKTWSQKFRIPGAASE